MTGCELSLFSSQNAAQLGVLILSHFFVDKGCDITFVDRSEENIDQLRKDYPDHKAFVADVQKDGLSQFGRFDIVFCYGLLYHLEDVVAGLRTMEEVCGDTLILETRVCDYLRPIAIMVDESKDYSQALKGLALIPSPSFIVMALNRIGFRHIYAPMQQPLHPQFQFNWKNDLSISRDGHGIRGVFIASRKEIHNSQLVSLI